MANCVCIKYNGILLAPTPMISLSRSFQDVGGRHVGSTLTISINGKIVGGTKPRTQGVADFLNRYPCAVTNINDVVGVADQGVNGLLDEEYRLKQVFVPNIGYLMSESDTGNSLGNNVNNPTIYNNTTNKFELIVNGNIILEGYGKVNSYNSDSDNNYLNTINYTAEIIIEENTLLFDDNSTKYLISSYTDTINIEPIEESNPFNSADPIVGTYFGSTVSYTTDYVNQLLTKRYRITRNVSAVGKHSHNITNSTHANSTNALGNRGVSIGTPFSNARFYVLDRLKHYPTIFFMSSDYTIVNRVKVLENNESEGSFSITETSLAINYAMHPPWIDDWTAEVSIDNTFLQTVRINGTVQGLETYSSAILYENSTFMDGSQPTSWGSTKDEASPGDDAKIHKYGELLPVALGHTPNSETPTAVESKVGKYQNALRGMSWLKNTPNPYTSPAYQRAALFFMNGTQPTPISSNLGLVSPNPYRWLNNQQLLAERATVPSNAFAAPMNPIPISMTENHRKNVGEIDYSFEFNNRPLNLIEGSISESLTINDTFPTQQIAEIFVLGRKLGPVLQDLGAVTSSSREVTFEIVIPRPRMIGQRLIFPANIFTAATGLVELLNPKYTFGTLTFPTNIKSYVKTDNHNYNPLEGRLSITKSWVWQRAK